MNKWQVLDPKIFADMFVRIVGTEFDDAWANRNADETFKAGRFVIVEDRYNSFDVFDIESAQAISFSRVGEYASYTTMKIRDLYSIADIYTTAGDDYESVGKFLKALAEELHKYNTHAI